MSYRSAIILLVLLLSRTSHAETPGVVTERPASGRFVEADGVYLVPHEVTIPGTRVTFAMEPIPAGDGFGPFWMARCEVTWAEYRQYMNLCGVFEKFDDRGLRRLTAENNLDGVTAPSKLYDPSFTFSAGEDPRLPAVSMSQYAAKQYTKWLSLVSGRFYRLPSDAEWEHACRAGESGESPFAGSAEGESDADEFAWHEGNSDLETHPVAQKKPNAWGLFDMHGNACEWVLDAPASEGGTKDPDGPGGEPPVAWPTKLYPRTLRGGSALLPAAELGFTSRRASDDNAWRSYDPNTPKSPWWFASDESQDVGFRLVAPYQPPPRPAMAKYWEAEVERIQRIADFRIDDEGRGERGLVDPDLPDAIKQLD